MDRLQAFETMLRDIQDQYESEKKAMDELKAKGKEKSATYRQYMGNRLMYGRMLDLYKQYDLLKEPETVEEYIFAQDEKIRDQLQKMREVLISRLPDATEKISWSMPTYWKDHNIIHFSAQKKHIGLYPGPEAVEHFAERLDQAGLKYSKGSIRIPYSDDLPLGLIAEIADWCRENGNHA